MVGLNHATVGTRSNMAKTRQWMLFLSKAKNNTFQVLHSRVNALALPINIRLGWKGLPGTNILAYYENT